MANDCLVTKLKGAVNNPNLDVLGEVTFTFLFQDRNTSCFSILANEGDGSPLKITILSDNAFFTDSSTHTENLGKELTFNNYYANRQWIKMSSNSETVKFKINKNYDINTLWGAIGGYIDFDWTKWGSDTLFADTQIYAAGIYRQYNFRWVRHMQRLQVVNFADVAGFDEAKMAYIQDVPTLASYVWGEYPLAILAESIKGSIRNIRNINGSANNNFTGTIESFVAAARSVLPTCDEFIIFSLSQSNSSTKYFTFNGTKCPNENTISWTATTITCNGTTITA